MHKRLTAGLLAVLVLALAAFTGSAFAGGNGSGSDHGNSANAPGHQDSTTPTQPPAPSQPSSKQSSTSASQPATGGDNSKGVKPSNSAKHVTYAKASSNQTTQYGNGKTAGQIATQAGYGDATLHGPGNSQPHKTMCGGHEVDVHALKNKGSKCGTTQASSTPVVKQENKGQENHGKSETKTESKSNSETKTEVKSTEATKTEVKTGKDAESKSKTETDTESESKSETDAESKTEVKSHEAMPAAGAAVTPAATATATPAPAGAVAGAGTTLAGSAPAGAVAGAGTTLAGSAPAAGSKAAPTAASGVKGAAVTLRPTKSKPATGVLGTTARLGGTVASANLPFTGLPLWIFAAAALALILMGVALRRNSAGRI